MRAPRRAAAAFAAALAACALPSPEAPPATPAPAPGEAPAERLASLRNLGKAFYENPATRLQAVEVLAEALALSGAPRDRLNLGLALLRAGRTAEGVAQLRTAQYEDPAIPHTWFNLGIVARRAGDDAEARHQLSRMLDRVPDDPPTLYNLGLVLKLDDDHEGAAELFRRAADVDPYFAAPLYQLAAVHRQAGRSGEAEAAMARFRALKAAQRDDAVPEDPEWGWFAELYDPAAAEPSPAAAATAPAFTARELAQLGPGPAGLAVLDADADGLPDLLAWSAAGVRLFTAARDEAPALPPAPGTRAAAPGDFDDDGLPDLAVAGPGGVALWRNRGAGRFEPVPLPAAGGGDTAALAWVDFDHDYDLDLFVLGEPPALLRNTGGGAFADHGAAFPFAPGRGLAATTLDLLADTPNIELAVARAGGGGTLYRDLLGGRHRAEPLPALPAGVHRLLAEDVDNDGWTDLVAAAAGGGVVLRNDRRGGFTSPAPAGAAGPLALADVEGRGIADLVAAGRLYRNGGDGSFAAGEEIPGLPADARDLLATDFDADGRVDLAAVAADGRLLVLANRTPSPHHYLRVVLQGVKNPGLAAAAEVEVKAGSWYRKRRYEGVPLVFGLGPHATADVVRITWPNGLIQNETQQAADRTVVYEEAQRLSGSCPMVFAWNGDRFDFVTDVLGVAPLGAAAGDGEYFDVDHDEYVQISGEQLVPRDGLYELRLTEELREVTFLDQVRLLALDHPAGVELYTGEKFKGPPYLDLSLYGVRRARRPVAARDHRGAEVTAAVAARDGAWPEGFARDFAGRAELHHLEIDFGPGPGDDDLLVLHGWVDWADGSTFLATSQGGSGDELVMPRLEVLDEAGRWVTVDEDMGLPAGKPKTIVVEMGGRWRSAHRRVRIVTSLCVYWDEAFLAADEGPPPLRRALLAPATAELRFRGFSGLRQHPRRTRPEWFDYGEVRPASMWNPTPGLYTRYGEVGELLAAADDRFVVFGSGDELALAFDPAGLAPPPAGWRRDFLLYVGGWAKDGDANTAHSQTVGPLPYHGMPGYPYDPPHAYPDGPEHRRYLEQYQTRPALRLLRPLRPAAGERR